MKNQCLILLTLLLLNLAGPFALAGAEAQFYIAPDGNDAWSGTLAAPNADKSDGPLATLDGARIKVREEIGRGLSHPVTVMIRGGEYPLNKTVVFTPEDSGSEQYPITYRAYPDEQPVFTGGKNLTGWKKVAQDSAGTSAAAQGRLWYCNIPSELQGKWQITSLYDNLKMLTRSRSGEFFVSKRHKQDRANAQPKDVGKILKFGDPSVTFDRTLCYENDDLKDWKNIRDRRFTLNEDGKLYAIPVTSDKERYSGKVTIDPAHEADRLRLQSALDEFQAIKSEISPESIGGKKPQTSEEKPD